MYLFRRGKVYLQVFRNYQVFYCMNAKRQVLYHSLCVINNKKHEVLLLPVQSLNREFIFRETSTDIKPSSLSILHQYEQVSEETLQSIGDRFEELLELSKIKDYDVKYSDGVLTVSLNQHGVYVINKQTPNRQIWLSSPISGPKRYDYVNGKWIYSHDGISLHQLLTEELGTILRADADFISCSYGN